MRMCLPPTLRGCRGWALLPLLVIPWLSTPAIARIVSVTDFTQFPQGWETRDFLGETHYTPVLHEGQPALEAVSRGTASGLIRRVAVDLRDTPYINWSWSVANRLDVPDERHRSGDDYPARLYVIFSTGPFFWQTRTINYVWSNHQPPGSVWPNAYTDHSTMVAVRGPQDETHRWLMEKRNVFEDIRRLTGEQVDEIRAVAIMTDTDNTGQQARAWYGRIYFSQR